MEHGKQCIITKTFKEKLAIFTPLLQNITKLISPISFKTIYQHHMFDSQNQDIIEKRKEISTLQIIIWNMQ